MVCDVYLNLYYEIEVFEKLKELDNRRGMKENVYKELPKEENKANQISKVVKRNLERGDKL